MIMRRFVVMCLVMLLLIGSASVSSAADQNLKVNRLVNNPDVKLYKETDLSVPQFVSGNLGPAVQRGAEVTATLSFLNESRSVTS